MGHNHNGCCHDHGTHSFSKYRDATTIGINALVVQCILVFVSGSLALRGDTIHLGADVVFLVGNLWVVWQANKIGVHGSNRLKTVAALVGIILLALGAWNVYVEAQDRIAEGAVVASGWMLAGGIIGFIANILMYRVLHAPEPANYVLIDGDEDKIVFRSPPLVVKHAQDHVVEAHIIADLLGSVVVIISAATSFALGWSIDSYAGIALAVFMTCLAVFLSWKVVRGEPIH